MCGFALGELGCDAFPAFGLVNEWMMCLGQGWEFLDAGYGVVTVVGEETNQQVANQSPSRLEYRELEKETR